MKIASFVSIVTILGWLVLSLCQLWGSCVDIEFYFKITLTIILLNLGVGISALIFREYVSENKMKKDKFLD